MEFFMNQNNHIIPLFGNKLRKEPFLIDTDTSITEKREKLHKLEQPDILYKTINDTHFGNTFNKILDDIEIYLQNIYNNQHSKKRFEASLQVTFESLDFDNDNSVQNNIQLKINNKLKPK